MALMGCGAKLSTKLTARSSARAQRFCANILAVGPMAFAHMNIQNVSPAELVALQLSRPDLVLLDVRLPEDFAAEHLRGAVNNCVFEVQFLERMGNLAAGLDVPICCYGNGEGSLESRVAATKLQHAGYRALYDFEAGIAAGEAAGLGVERHGSAAKTPAPRDGLHAVELAESWVEWTGRNLLNLHHGRVALRRGVLSVQNGRLTGGEIVLDMNAITCHDLAGSPLHDVLIAHLRSDDFFETERYPEATLLVTATSISDDATPGSPNLAITGDLTLKGVTHALEFTACAGVAPDGRLAAQADFPIDRCRWNVIYGSGKFFKRLGGHLVNDLIGIRLRIVASPASEGR
jgi:rhodanese-related sulfurtransferase